MQLNSEVVYYAVTDPIKTTGVSGFMSGGAKEIKVGYKDVRQQIANQTHLKLFSSLEDAQTYVQYYHRMQNEGKEKQGAYDKDPTRFSLAIISAKVKPETDGEGQSIATHEGRVNYFKVARDNVKVNAGECILNGKTITPRFRDEVKKIFSKSTPSSNKP